jgi:hypothetical protein
VPTLFDRLLGAWELVSYQLACRWTHRLHAPGPDVGKHHAPRSSGVGIPEPGRRDRIGTRSGRRPATSPTAEASPLTTAHPSSSTMSMFRCFQTGSAMSRSGSSTSLATSSCSSRR